MYLGWLKLRLPLIIHKDGTIYFYKELLKNDEVEISNYLKRTTVQIQYTEKIEVYKIEDYSIVSLLLIDDDSIDEFINFLYKYSYNEIPDVLTKHIKTVKENMKLVSLTLTKAEIIIKVMRGDLSFLNDDKKIINKLRKGKNKETYVYPREDNYELIRYLVDKDVNMTFPSIDTEGTVEFNSKEHIVSRYYQEQAYSALVNKKKGLAVMPKGSGKTYVGIRLIQYIKKVTLILCENKDNCYRWKELLLKHLDISDDDISLCIEESNKNKISKINIYSYDMIRATTDETIFERLFENKWGLVIYDNAHKVVTDKAVDLLYLQSTYKFAFDSTLSRSDGGQRSLLKLFGGITYNISSDELVNNLYQKKLECYQVDLRKVNISEVEFIRHVLKVSGERNLLVVAFKKGDMQMIHTNTGIRYVNGDIEYAERVQLVDDFNQGKLKSLCIGNLIENYSITNVDVMIAVGYRGKTEIEENFRIGTLVSTPKKLLSPTISQMFYIIESDNESNKVTKKAGYLSKWGVSMKKLDVGKFLGDDSIGI